MENAFIEPMDVYDRKRFALKAGLKWLGPDELAKKATTLLHLIQIQKNNFTKGEPMHYNDYETMIYGEDGENPVRPTILRCIQEASAADTRLKVEIRVKHLGTTTSKAEHTFIVDAKEEHADIIIANIKDRLEAAPGMGFEGQIRINFYASGSMATKYGSYTRQIRSATPEGYGGGWR